MKIILVNPPSGTNRSPEEHLGLAYIKSSLSRYQYDIEIIDGYLFHLNNNSIIQSIISDHSCRLVGISPYIDSLEYALAITREVKRLRPDIHICWGGHLASFSAVELLSLYPCIDSVVRGEGEQTFLELAEMVMFGLSLRLGIKGLIVRDGAGMTISPPRNLIEDLDELPFPDRSNSLKSYQSGSLAHISGSRGCYGNCSFCSINSLYRLSDGKAWRGRSPKNIVEELSELQSKYGFDSFKFVDDSFFGPDKIWRSRGIELAERIIESGLKIRFRISVRANNVDEEVFKALKEAGLYAVSIGIESGVQRMLNTFGKGLTVRQNSEALDVLRKLEIITLMGFIGFDPYVTLEEINQNIAFLEQNSFAITDILSKPLYVHADDAITKKLLSDGLIIGRDFPNYRYKIIDRRSADVFKLMREWNSCNKTIYYEISEPLTAPRRTSKKEEEIILSLCRELGATDLTILKDIAKKVGAGYPRQVIRTYLEKKKRECSVIWDRAKENFLALR
jgi:radical SAM superfamily enzyme YgiQ (UPF0313 family)